MKNYRTYIYLTLGAVFAITAFFVFRSEENSFSAEAQKMPQIASVEIREPKNSDTESKPNAISLEIEDVVESKAENNDNGLVPPMDRAGDRITKKHFGTYITPETSPVQPDKFLGYHTGVDWEIFPEELEQDVPIRAICNGELILKKYATGYGGVAVEECELNGHPITVVYGHLDLASIKKKAGQNLIPGEIVGVLGDHKSQETDGARKHLHLAIHKGRNCELKGYIEKPENLTEWLDPCLHNCCRS